MIVKTLLWLLPIWALYSTHVSAETAVMAWPKKLSSVTQHDEETLLSHKKLARLARLVWESNNQVDYSRVFSKDYINHQIPSIVGKPLTESRQEWQSLVNHFHQSFSNVKEEILLQIAESEFVVTQWQTTGTQTGEYLGFSATGKRVSWSGIQIDKFEQGQIVESWVVWDMYSLFSQLGFIPALGNN
ncbi:ester cyclase [uncultured Shewanella sp.]|uniref:ester cyclase n=1 Tax=uncultured Shewanella sp. TaxID=173975 RepID=UPI0026324143|nr:ester cyclase [uncultured Shewanella sp.]